MSSSPHQPKNATTFQLRLRAELERAAPFKEDARLAEALAAEAEPVLDALVADRPAQHEPFGHEALTMVGLLGRRAGALGCTPTALLGLEGAVLRLLSERELQLSGAAKRALVAALLEGYVAGREERLLSQLSAQVAAANTVFELAPKVLGLLVVAPLEHPALEGAFAEAERALLRHDARALVVSLRHVARLDDGLSRLVAGVCLTAESLGARAYLAEASSACLERLAQLGVATPLPPGEPFVSAVRSALALADLELRPSAAGWARELWRRLASSSSRSS